MSILSLRPDVLSRALGHWLARFAFVGFLGTVPLAAEQVSFDEPGYQPGQHPPTPWHGDLREPGFPLTRSPLVVSGTGVGASQALAVQLASVDGRSVGHAFYELPRPLRRADGRQRISVKVAPAPYRGTEMTELFGGQAWLGAAYVHAGARAAQELAGVEFYFLKTEPGAIESRHFRIQVIRQTPSSFIHEAVAELGSFVAGGGYYEVSWETDAAWSRYTITVVTPDGESRAVDINAPEGGVIERIYLEGSVPMVSETGVVMVGDPTRFDDLVLPDVPPRFATALRSQTVLTGWSTAFEALADGTPPLAYQWYHDGQPLPGEQGPTLLLTELGAQHAGAYHVTVTGPRDALTSEPVQLTVLEPPAREPQYLVAWGENASGQTDLPPGLTEAVAIGAGETHSLAVTADGRVIAWGDNTLGQTEVPADIGPVLTVAGGAFHSLALGRDGALRGWGNNGAGQAAAPEGVSNLIAIATASAQTLAIRSDHTVAAWIPGTEPPAPLEDVVQLAAGTYHFVALHRDGRVTAWGGIAYDETHPSPPNLTEVIAVACGSAHALALTAQGRVVAWGDNSLGQSEVPSDLPEVQAIAAGHSHSLALTRDGRVVAWGSQNTVPPWLKQVTAIAAGAHHHLALMRVPLAPPPPPHLRLATAPDGTVQLQIQREPGWSCLIETSPDLSQWTPLETLLLPDTPISYTEVPGDPGPRFYRALISW